MDYQSAVSQRADTQSTYDVTKELEKFLLPSVGGMLNYFPPFKSTDSMKCVREL